MKRSGEAQRQRAQAVAVLASVDQLWGGEGRACGEPGLCRCGAAHQRGAPGAHRGLARIRQFRASQVHSFNHHNGCLQLIVLILQSTPIQQRDTKVLNY